MPSKSKTNKPKSSRDPKFSRRRGRNKEEYIFVAERNPLKEMGITKIDWKDVELLKKFISDRGKIRARAMSGVTVKEQHKLAQAIKNAREMALLPYIGRKKYSS
jgi:small subunit ribosomal protein S18